MSSATVEETAQLPRLQSKYREEILPALRRDCNRQNIHEVAGRVKVGVNRGGGYAARDSKVIDGAIGDRTDLTGQKPSVNRGRKPSAQFKLREGQPIGAHV